MNATEVTRAKFSIPSIIALIAAILSFSTGAIFGLVLAAVAIVFGILGVVLAMSPRIRGGLLSIFALVAGLLGIVAAVFKAIGWFV